MAAPFYPTNYGYDPANNTPFVPQPVEQSSDPMFFAPDDYENEPPLLEELGINFDHIRRKTMSVLNPFSRQVDQEILDDVDLAGPFVFSMLLGALLLLRGKWTFDYIYGFNAVGCVALYFLVNVMSHDDRAEVSIYKTISTLGYCLLPMTLLALTSLLLPPTGPVGFLLAALVIVWCTASATTLFTYPHMLDQKLLVAYPLFLFYACFALLTIY